jgi:hypothetical protein
MLNKNKQSNLINIVMKKILYEVPYSHRIGLYKHAHVSEVIKSNFESK